ncbi:extracellular lipase [Pseudovirgaria hyperparasitica]|uniref:Extracellular lipase n=1 Tax=Pseudovirgaria hyperparasitica TaxID=470096 RepID=A0A6A6WE13_9PEZI|nr:extracellular lipase [Pseudovirgaria hyperparasitica]KAF2759351.1 extracellular lipase [Pseudovirgaria hyperparasitica]
MRTGSFLTYLLGAQYAFAHPAQIPLLHYDNTTVSTILFNELEELARIVDISYCVGITGLGIQKPFQCASRCSEFKNFELVKAWNTGPLLSDSCGYVVLSHPPSPKRIIVAFRGTYSLANTIADLSTVPQEYVPYPGGDDDDTSDLPLFKQIRKKSFDAEDDVPSAEPPKCNNCTVHMGFNRSWLNTRTAILEDLADALDSHPDYQLTLVGHSLGGAVATLAALDLKARGWDPITTTFGEPRIGNEHFVHYIDAIFGLPSSNSSSVMTESKMRRVTHADDPVPLLPLEEWGYQMHGGEVFISKPDLSPEVHDVRHCRGDDDHDCIAGNDNRTPTDSAPSNHDIESFGDVGTFFQEHLPGESHSNWWSVPTRYKLWQLFFAHRDYFWRLGLCIPGGDPKDWYRKYPHYEDGDEPQ